MLMAMQILDALFLLGTVVCALILLAEDPTYRSGWPRAGLALMGTALFAQAMWLLGVWIPGVTGYPIPRLMIDGCMVALSAHRAIIVAREAERLKRSLRRQKNGSYA